MLIKRTSKLLAFLSSAETALSEKTLFLINKLALLESEVDGTASTPPYA